MSDSDFNFDELEAQFAELDALLKAEGTSNVGSGRAPAWVEASKQAILDDHEANCTSDDHERCNQEHAEFVDQQIERVIRGQLHAELELEVQGEIDESRHGLADDAQFTLRFNGSLGRALAWALQSAVPAMQVKLAMEAAFQGGLEPAGAKADLDGLEALRWLIVDLGQGLYSEALLPEAE